MYDDLVLGQLLGMQTMISRIWAIRTVLTITVVLASFAIPSAALAGTFNCSLDLAGKVLGCTSTATQMPNYYGKAWLNHPQQEFSNGTVAGVTSLPITAWRWSGSWKAVSIQPGTCSPIIPGFPAAVNTSGYCWHSGFGSGWSWIWNSRDGWLAVKSSLVGLSIPTSYVSSSTRTSCVQNEDPNHGGNTLIGWVQGWQCTYIR